MRLHTLGHFSTKDGARAGTTFMFVYIKANTESRKKVLELHPFLKSSQQEQETAVSMWKIDSTTVESSEIMSVHQNRLVLNCSDSWKTGKMNARQNTTQHTN